MKQITPEEIEQASELEYREFPTEVAGSMNHNKDIHCFKKRKAFIKGAKWAISQMQPEWVAVTPETKPESGKHYFALIKAMNGKFIKCVAAYTEGWDLEVDSEGDEDHLNHSEENSMSYMPKGWYESCEQQGGSYDEVYFKRDVVYYLPNIELPQPPTK